MLVVIAGVPQPFGDAFATAFARIVKYTTVQIATWLPLDWTTPYSDRYAVELYNRLADHLARQGEHIPENVNLVMAYLAKRDGSHRFLIDRFGVEALVVRVEGPITLSNPLNTRNQRNHAVNTLTRSLRKALKPIRTLLNVIAREVTSGDRTTCLLLPPKTTGKQMRKTIDLLHTAAQRAGDFKEELRRVAQSIPRSGKYFRCRQCVFRPADRRARHGNPPSWGDKFHRSSCVIRGRLRFGVPFDSGFHYDCEILRGAVRRFPGCHEPAVIPSNRRHVNVAPNDNVR